MGSQGKGLLTEQILEEEMARKADAELEFVPPEPGPPY